MKKACCCEGLKKITPISIDNRPGLSAISYRVGTYASFLETMEAGISMEKLEVPSDVLSEQGELRNDILTPLQGLTVRFESDPSIALMDAWATVADVITFYQERIANEGYLRTATERRSILELARLIGYKLKPGVSSSVFLAYTLEDGYKDVTIPAGSRSQTVPGQGELPQSFETSEDLEASYEWNNLKPRMSLPQNITEDKIRAMDLIDESVSRLHFKGAIYDIQPNSPLLLFFPESASTNFGDQFRMPRVKKVEVRPEADKTVVYLQHVESLLPAAQKDNSTTVGDLLSPNEGLLKLQTVHSSSPLNLDHSLKSAFPLPDDPRKLKMSTSSLHIVTETSNVSADDLSTALGNAKVTDNPNLKGIEALKVKAKPFGHNAPLNQIYDKQGLNVGQEEWPINGTDELELKIYMRRYAEVFWKHNSDVLYTKVFLEDDTKVELKELDQNASIYLDEDHKIINFIWRSKKVGIEFDEPIGSGTTTSVNIQFTPGLSQEKNTTVNLPINRTWRRHLIGRRVEIDFSSDGISVLDQSISAPELNIVYLDAQYDKITPGSMIVIFRPPNRAGKTSFVRSVTAVDTVSRTDYGISGTVTKLTLNAAWLDESDLLLSIFRNTTIYAQNETIELLPAPLEEPVCKNDIELDGYVSGLKPGRWVIVSGERTDIPLTSHIFGSELTMLAGISQDVHRAESGAELPGDKYHTVLHLENDLSYCYKRDTVTIYGNVVKATHGETHREILGSGDAGKSTQQFALHQSPLTMTSAPTKSGIKSSLQVRVNDLLWHESESLVDLGDTDRGYVTFTNEDDKVTVVFGDGKNGLRPTTGVENIRADYRTGIGVSGNIKAGQISQLMSRPYGVKAVVNPKPSSGGADRESSDQARRNAPTALMALDRLVSVKDYADFARTFAGIAKSSSVKISDGRRQVVHITIAGEDDISIEETSDLFINLRQALHKFGDPYQPLKIAIRDLIMLIINAKVRVLPDYQWESIEPKVRTALLDAFSFEKRNLGQNAYLGEIISIIQSVKGVDFVDVDVFGGIPEKILDANSGEYSFLTPVKIGSEINRILEECEKGVPPRKIEANLARANKVNSETIGILPAQIAYLKPSLEDTLILAELKR
jgi:hypothetical protein